MSSVIPAWIPIQKRHNAYTYWIFLIMFVLFLALESKWKNFYLIAWIHTDRFGIAGFKAFKPNDQNIFLDVSVWMAHLPL